MNQRRPCRLFTGLPPKRGTALRFAELAQEWIATYPAVRTLAANTRNNYEWFIREHLIPYFGNMAVTDIDYQTVEAFIALKRSPKGCAWALPVRAKPRACQSPSLSALSVQPISGMLKSSIAKPALL